MEKWQAEIEGILREHYPGDEHGAWPIMTEELIKLTREVESPSGSMGQFVEQVLKIASEKNCPLMAAYIGFRIGGAYERYQNTNRGVK